MGCYYSTEETDHVIKDVEELSSNEVAFLTQYKMKVYISTDIDYVMTTIDMIANEFKARYNKEIPEKVLYDIYAIK